MTDILPVHTQLFAEASPQPRKRGLREELFGYLDRERMGRGDNKTMDGIAGVLERAHAEVSDMFGRSAQTKEASRFTEFAKSNKASVETSAAEIAGLDFDKMVNRLSGDEPTIRVEVEALLRTRQGIADRRASLQDGVQKLEESINALRDDHKDSIAIGFDLVIQEREEYFATLKQLWQIQGNVDKIQLAEHLAASYDEKASKPPEKVGGKIRKLAAWITNVPTEVGYRGEGFMDPKAVDNKIVEELVHSVKADVLGSRATPLERFELWKAGLISTREVGSLAPNDMADISRTNADADSLLKQFQDNKSQPPASMKDQIALLKRIEVGRMNGLQPVTDRLFRDWKQSMEDLKVHGFIEAPITELMSQAGQFGKDWGIYIWKDAGGKLRVKYEDFKEALIQPTVNELLGTAAARETAAAAYQKALSSGDAKATLEAAHVLRGAQTMYDRTALFVARINNHIERGIGDVPRAAADILTGGITGGGRVENVATAIAERSHANLNGEGILEGKVVSEQDTQTADALVAELFKNVPAHCASPEAMEKWIKGHGIIYEKLLKGISAFSRDIWKESDLLTLLTAGSRRSTISEVIGKKGPEAQPDALYSAIAKASAAQREISEGIDSVDAATGQGIDTLTRSASLTALREAQDVYLRGEANQMVRRNRLDEFWMRSVTLTAAVPITAVVANVMPGLSHMAQAASADQQTIYNLAAAKAATIQELLGNVSEIANPAHRQWASEAGPFHLLLAELQKSIASMNLEGAQAQAGVLRFLADNMGIVAAATGGIAFADTSSEAAIRFFNRHKTSLGAPKPTIT